MVIWTLHLKWPKIIPSTFLCIALDLKPLKIWEPILDVCTKPVILQDLLQVKRRKVNKIGYVAAYPIPEVVRGINAFALGVRQANKNAKVYVVWTHTWYDPSKERSAAEGLLKTQGVDIIAQHQDSPGPQQAAQEHGKFAIGYNADMKKFAPKAHLVAAVWNWGVVSQIHR